MTTKDKRPLKWDSGNRKTAISHDSEINQRAVNNSSGSPVYIGRAQVGRAETEAVWQCQKITYDAQGSLQKREWRQDSSSNATTDYEHIWDDATSATVTGITQADPAVVTTSAAHGFSNGDFIVLESIGGMVEVEFQNNSDRIYKVANVTATTFELNDADDANIDSSAFTAYTSGGTTKAPDYANATYS